MKFKIVLMLLLSVGMLKANLKLSPQAEIHVLTCGPYQGELYSAFGHTAIRVQDTAYGYDLVFNYGVFNYNQPNFYLNFAKGFLYYRLAVHGYQGFIESYIEEDRYVHEQVLNLTHSQKEKLFDFLQWNARPENMNYTYDYFYDNCATRVRDAIYNLWTDSIRFNTYITEENTIRSLTDKYLQQQAWGDLGIDLCLGMPMDIEATDQIHMFLPDYLEGALDHAEIKKGDAHLPLVKKTIITHKVGGEQLINNSSFWSPTLVFSLLFVLGTLLTIIGIWHKKKFYAFDIILMGIVGLLGWLLIILWFFTDHNAAANNLNVLWAMPLYFPMVFFIGTKKKRFVKWFFKAMLLLHILTLIFWAVIPQDLPDALMPLVALLALRAAYIHMCVKKRLA